MTLASKIDVPNNAIDVKIMKKDFTSHCSKSSSFWSIRRVGMTKFHFEKLESTFLNYGCKEFERFIVVYGELYHRGVGGVFARALSLNEAK